MAINISLDEKHVNQQYNRQPQHDLHCNKYDGLEE
jgi:hypothetical protein